jgi:transposase InsO family protein
MINASNRGSALELIKEAVVAGARLAPACGMLGLSVRTVQRWRHKPVDGRPEASLASPANKLSAAERAAVLLAINQPGYASLTPHQIVPKLADTGVYLASESTFYRVMKEAGQASQRGRCRIAKRRPLTTHRADGPNQVWVWDITWLPTTVKGRFFYWYMFKDVYSRKLVIGDVFEAETAELAARLLNKGCLRENITGVSRKPLVLHSDNGAAMKGVTMLAAMQDLGVVSSFSRPRVSNDNAFAEALFRTAKYCPMWPERPFDTLEAARLWVQKFTSWYNDVHRHSALEYVTPTQRHSGLCKGLLAQRKILYAEAKARHPNRWTADVRNWEIEDAVFLNPERVQAALKRSAKSAA